jgi:hypothetical protein
VDNFSKTVELLVTNEAFLEEEILKINAQNPSVQRILISADDLLIQEKFFKLIQHWKGLIGLPSKMEPCT